MKCTSFWERRKALEETKSPASPDNIQKPQDKEVRPHPSWSLGSERGGWWMGAAFQGIRHEAAFDLASEVLSRHPPSGAPTPSTWPQHPPAHKRPETAHTGALTPDPLAVRDRRVRRTFHNKGWAHGTFWATGDPLRDLLCPNAGGPVFHRSSLEPRTAPKTEW